MSYPPQYDYSNPGWQQPIPPPSSHNPAYGHDQPSYGFNGQQQPDYPPTHAPSPQPPLSGTHTGFHSGQSSLQPTHDYHQQPAPTAYIEENDLIARMRAAGIAEGQIIAVLRRPVPPPSNADHAYPPAQGGLAGTSASYYETGAPGDDRGLMGAIAGGAAGAYGGHQLGHGVIGGLVGALAGSKLEDTYHDHHNPSSGQHKPDDKPAGKWPLQLPPGSKIVFEYYPTGIEKDKKMGKIHSYALVQPGTSTKNPYYTSTFVDDKRFSKHAGLRMHQQGRWIASCSFHSSEKIKPKHPWTEWEKWSPEREPWASDTGALPGQWLLWAYDWQDKPAKEKNAMCILRCAYEDDEAKEVARVVMYQDEQGKIELASEVFKSQDALDEVVSNCFMQMQRKRNGWVTGAESTSSGGFNSGAS